MPRGEETQEVPQKEEGREQSNEIKEQDLEAQRDAEIVAEPEAVIERERPVAESEAIEAAVVQAIEAAAEAPALSPDDVKEEGGRGTEEAAGAAADGGRMTEDGGGAAQKLPEEEVRNQPGSGGGEVAATPINLPNVAEEPDHGPNPLTNTAQVDQAVRSAGEQPGGDVAATPINLPNVAEDPDHGPNPLTNTAQVDQAVRTAGEQPGGDVAATPINLPNVASQPDPAEPPPPPDMDNEIGREVIQDPDREQAVRSAGEQPGGDVAATPINLPNVADNPDPIFQTAQTEAAPRAEGQVIEETTFIKESQAEVDEVILDDGVPDETSFKVESPLPEGEIMAEAAPEERQVADGEDPDQRELQDETELEPGTELIDGDPESAEMDPDAPLDGTEQVPPEEISEESEKSDGIKDASELGLDWFVHEDGDGNKTVVDADGNPVKSPPVLIQYQGKTYATYPGDKPAIDEKGVIQDPSKLIELSGYETNMGELFLHEHSDGSVTVVDKDGNPVPSQPSIITYKGKKYIGYPGQDLGIDEQGNITDKNTLDSHEANYFKQSTEGMFIHDDGQGNLTVVDDKGNPVSSQPAIITYQGKNYIVYPGQDIGIDEQGKITDPNAMKKHEASLYEQPTDGMLLHDDGQGNLTVVDETGKPVSSQPTIITYEGKNYIIYPGQDAGIDEQGKVTDPKKLQAHEANYYEQSIDGMSIHDDGEGNLTVVDRKGIPVDSPPIIVENDDGMYITYPGMDVGIDSKGKVTDPAKYKSHQVSFFDQDTDDMFIHDDGNGNYTVVDGEGQPVDSPPIIVEKDGKVYATYPGWDDGIDEKGTVTDPNKLKQREISFYTPPWWQKKGL